MQLQLHASNILMGEDLLPKRQSATNSSSSSLPNVFVYMYQNPNHLKNV